MDMEGLQCHGCGSSNVQFAPEKRILQCNQCGKEEYYSRATLNSNGKVAFGRRNAIRFFTEGKLEDARHYAMDVLNISMDNAPALYILTYYDQFTAKKPDAIKQFFKKIKDVSLEYEEVQEICELLLASAYNLGDFEEEVIALVAANMQSADDTKGLCDFVDKFCPYLIAKRTSSNFLTENLAGMYQELAAHCAIPKTCFSLLKSVETNPDSPYANDSFYLKAKAQYFYEHYVVQIGKVIHAINDSSLKEKFLVAYKNKCAKYTADAGIA